ncbi:MAG: hypothetical protein J7L54_00595 [Elusimicrobia bacterium]|nr:hypothetical protein [Elusimicrobiota bacterium]
MGAKGWEINNKVKAILTKNHLNVLKLLINTVKDVVLIKGELNFKGGSVDEKSDASVVEGLKKIEREIFQIKGVKMVKWELAKWEKRSGRWVKRKLKHKSGS